MKTQDIHGGMGGDKRSLLKKLLSRNATFENGFPLSIGQVPLWLFARLLPGSPAYNLHNAYRIDGPLDVAALCRALDRIVARHEALRTVFENGEKGPLQTIKPASDQVLRVVDLGAFEPGQSMAAAHRLSGEEARRPYDLARGPLYRTTLFRCAPRQHLLVVMTHHIVFDMRSMGLFMTELDHFYGTEMRGGAPSLPRPEMQPGAYAQWERERLSDKVMAAQHAYWTHRLKNIQVTELDPDFPRPPYRGFRGRAHSFRLPDGSGQALASLADSAGASLFMTNLAAFHTLLHLYTGQNEINCGTPISNRSRKEVAHTIGFFINILILATDFSGNPSFRQVLEQVRRRALEAYDNPNVPVDQLSQKLARATDPARDSMFQIIFQQGTLPALALFGTEVKVEFEMDYGVVRADLEVYLNQDAGGARGLFVYNADLYREQTIRSMARHFRILLDCIAREPDRPVNAIELLDMAGRKEVLEIWSRRPASPDGPALPLSLFNRVVRNRPEGTAVASTTGLLTFAGLDRCTAKLAGQLRLHGIVRESVVAVRLPPGLERAIALLAILRAGGVYLPMDEESPPQRVAYMLQDSGAGLVLVPAARSGEERLPETVPRLNVPRLLEEVEESGIADAGRTEPEHSAYMIYTSGSTGRPKSVLVKHGGLGRLALEQQRLFGVGPADRVLQFAASSFDASVWEMSMALLSGAALRFGDKASLRPGPGLLGLLREQYITNLTLTPTALSLVPRESLPALRTLVLAGEAGRPGLLMSWCCGNREVFNAYGPSEDTVCSSAGAVREGDRYPGIGNPLGGHETYVLGPGLQVLPAGIAGELCLAGSGLARGYHRRFGLTAERFIPHPFPQHAGMRLYRTGDKVAWTHEGALRFVGRIDRQVKVRGIRIELGEVEAALAAHPEVAQVVVALWQPEGKDVRLIAYLAPQRGRALHAPELRAFLAASLPEYMIPSHFQVMDALPALPSGKVDARALPVPQRVALDSGSEFVAPAKDGERLLAEIWRDLLAVERVGINDNFFEIGGNSVLIARMIPEIEKRFSKRVTAVTLFQYPRIRDLARFLKGESQSEREDERIRWRERLERGGNRVAEPQGEAPDGAGAIAIIGMAGRFPDAPDTETFWKNLCDGVESLRDLTDEELRAAGVDPDQANDSHYVKKACVLEDEDRFDAGFFAYSPREAEIMDPQHRLFLEVAWTALEHAGCDPGRYRTGVIAGMSLSGYLFNHQLNAGTQAEMGSFQTVIGNDKDFISTNVAYKLNLDGPCYTVQTACSTSLVCVHLACKALRHGEADVMLAGGVSVRFPQRTGYLYQEGMIFSPDGHCRAFDAEAQGCFAGNGLGMVVLKRLDRALADRDTVYAVIKGSALNNDGSDKAGFTAPGVKGQSKVIAGALAAAGVNPETIGYVETHGTGTPLGDPIEIAALNSVYRAFTERTGYCALASVKSNIGHLDTAAGVAGLIKAALSVHHGRIPPSLHFHRPNPELQLEKSPFFVNTELRDWPKLAGPRRAAVSSFGIGGTNVHLILEQAPPLPATKARRSRHLFALSAKTETAMARAMDDLAAYCKARPRTNPADIAFTLLHGHRRLKHRLFLVCSGVADAAEILSSKSFERIFRIEEERERRKVAFLFPGGGAQYVHMAAETYRQEPVFRETVDAAARLLTGRLGEDLLDIVFPKPQSRERADRLMRSTATALPALFVIEYAMAKLLMSWGLRPSAMIGHSLGEYTAACLAGVFSFEDALALVVTRGQLFETLPSGAMVNLPLNEEQVLPFLGDALSIAAINGPSQTVVSGPESAIEELATTLRARDIDAKILHIDVAAHSKMIDPILGRFGGFVRTIRLNPPQLPYISNVTGTWIAAEEATDPNYYVTHLRRTIRFGQGVSELFGDADTVLIEVGPSRSLSSIVQASENKPAALKVFNSLPHPSEDRDDFEHLLETLGRLWLEGVDMDWDAFFAGEDCRKRALPTYPFERKPYSMPVFTQTGTSRTPKESATRARKPPAEWFYAPCWKARPAPVPSPKNAGEPLLILAPGQGLGAALGKALSEGDRRVLAVVAGPGGAGNASRTHSESVRRRLRPEEPQDYRALLDDLEASATLPSVVVHLCDLEDGGLGDGARSLETLLRVLGNRDPSRIWRVTAVTGPVRPVGAEPVPQREGALVEGVALSLPRTFPNLCCRILDTDLPKPDPASHHRLAGQIGTEAFAEDWPFYVALRRSQRWALAYEPIALANPAEPTPGEAETWLFVGRPDCLLLETARVLTRSRGIRSFFLVGEEDAARIDPDAGEVLPLGENGWEMDALAARLDGLPENGRGLGGVVYRPRHEGDATRDLDMLRSLGKVLEKRQVARRFIFCASSTAPDAECQARTRAALQLAAFARLQEAQGDTPWTVIEWEDGAPSITGKSPPFENPAAIEEIRAAVPRLLSAEGLGHIVVSPFELASRGVGLSSDPAGQQPEPEVSHSALEDEGNRPNLSTPFVSPRDPLEKAIVEVWQRILGIGPIGIWDNFFELGGSSLLVTRVYNRLRELFRTQPPAGFEALPDLPLKALFKQPTPARLAEKIRGAEAPRMAGAPPMTHAPAGVRLPLSFAQKRLWVMDRLTPENPFFNLPAAIKVSGPLDPEALASALAEIVRRHQILRTRFEGLEDDPYQVVMPFRPRKLAVEEVSDDAKAQTIAREESRRIFDLGQGGPWSTRLLRLGAERHVLILIMHHILADGWSFRVWMRELEALYCAFKERGPSPLPELEFQYADYAFWQRGWMTDEVLAERIRFVADKLAGMPQTLTFPADRDRPAVVRYRGSVARFPVSEPLSESLSALGLGHGATRFMTMLSGFLVLFRHHTGSDDLALGTDAANRSPFQTEAMIGFFVNQLVLRFRVAGTDSVTELLTRVHDGVLEAFEYQDLPFEKLVEAIKPRRDPGFAPMFQVKLVYQETDGQTVSFGGLSLELEEIERGSAQLDLILNMMDGPEGLSCMLEFNTDLFDRTTIADYFQQLTMVWQWMCDHPGAPIEELDDKLDRHRRRARLQQLKTKGNRPGPGRIPRREPAVSQKEPALE